MTVTAREVLDSGAEQLQHSLDDQPLVRARLLDTIGRVYLTLGLSDDAEPLLKDPQVVSANDYQIVGFIKVRIFDVDVGNLPESNLDMCGGPFLGMNPYAVNGPKRFTYNRSATACNMVRARTQCNINFLASTDNADPFVDRYYFTQ